MKTFLLICAVLFSLAPGRSDLEVDRVCGYGTARCRRKCKSQERKISRCPNTYTCCLKAWAYSSLNINRPSLQGRPPEPSGSPEQPGARSGRQRGLLSSSGQSHHPRGRPWSTGSRLRPPACSLLDLGVEQ
ncbi:Beta-defensin 104A [Fukomys damarensis]|uniref:Beta-defensin n=1 Tax=Fukomys damarensis TaxID=885580 RepID=A0A091E0Y9_FUKDA|nr:Beta-defensin 104A [Fukomys damarensis]